MRGASVVIFRGGEVEARDTALYTAQPDGPPAGFMKNRIGV